MVSKKENLRILHIFPSAHSGGSEKSALETIKSLSDIGIIQYALFPRTSPFIESVKPYFENCDIFEYNWWLSEKPWPFLLKIKMLRGFLYATLRIAKFIKDNQIDLVITHSIVVPSGALGAAKAGCRHIWYLHEYGDIDHRFTFNYGKPITMKLIDWLSSKIIVNSKALQNYFATCLPAYKIYLVYYAVSANSNLKATLQKPAGCLKICMTGRIAPGKNQLTALKSLSILKQENIYPVITFVGNANESYLLGLQQYISEEQLDKQVVFAGQQQDPLMYVKQAHCVLVCSMDEAFGRVTIEGMKAGKVPVIANTGAGPEIIQDGKTGFLFPPTDSHKLAKILKKLWMMSDIGLITTEAQRAALEMCNSEKHRGDILKVVLN